VTLAVNLTLAVNRAALLPCIAADLPSAIIFDYQSLSGLTRVQTQRNYVYAVLSRISGERRDFGIEKSQIEDFLTRRGFTHVMIVNAEQLKRLYCTGPNQGRTVAENYAIVHAQVGESQV